MVNGNKIIEEARTWVGTPFHHQGRVKHVGVDCAGLVVGVAKFLGYTHHDADGYSRIPYKQMLQTHLECDADVIQGLEHGCILLMSFDTDPQHLAIYSKVDDSVIHAYYDVRKCCEHTLDDKWRSRICGVYRYRSAV